MPRILKVTPATLLSVKSSEYKRGQACDDYKIKTQVGNGQCALTRKLASGNVAVTQRRPPEHVAKLLIVTSTGKVLTDGDAQIIC